MRRYPELYTPRISTPPRSMNFAAMPLPAPVITRDYTVTVKVLPQLALPVTAGVTVWLDCPFEVVERRVALASHRPLARDPHQFAALYQARLEAYAQAHVRVPIGCVHPLHAVDAPAGCSFLPR